MLRTRLEKAREDYVEKYIDLFSNGESLEHDHIFELYDAYVNQFLQELYVSEDETARMIARGGWFDEINFLKPVFDHFKSKKIYEAIVQNCEHALMQTKKLPNLIVLLKQEKNYKNLQTKEC